MESRRGRAAAADRDRKSAEFPIVVIGASAGGLDAFRKFLSATPADSGMAFVLVPHLDPKHESFMVELLTKHTAMPVREAAQGKRIEPNHVYVIPPKKYLAVRHGALALSAPPEPRAMGTAIDFALRSLADDQGDAAIGIILSGTGSHGVLGAKEIKLAGGVVFVQDPKTAEYDQMPRSALSAGIVDQALPPEKMPAALIRYWRNAHSSATREAELAEATQDGLRSVLGLLQARTKHDFRHYRKNMLTRRIKRRMALLRIDEWRGYVEHLRETPDEVTALYQDLLIGVTSFFRDPDAFAALAANVLPKLVARASPEVPVRVWVPGCASGEEAYSIAILLIEQFRAADKAASVQIFATDIDERSLETARQGVYPGSIASALSPERLERFFVRLDEHRYQVSKELRDSIVVAPQSLTSDAPFSKLDLISCRNVLIYLEPGIQEKVISLLHFALKDDGYLLLGPAESIGRATGMFEAISKKWRLYRRIGPARRNLVSLPITATAERRRRAAPPAPTRRSPGVLAQMMQRLLAEDFAPAAALIDREYEILSVQGPLGDYLEFPRGEMTKDLLTMTRQGLRVKVRAVCEKALRESHTVIDAGARVRRNGHYVPCTVTARPVTGPQEAGGLLLVVFQDRAEGRHGEPNAIVHDEGDAVVKQLEDDLRATRADLQSTIEDLESSNEELKASNEEIMSMNEELQSANEELETSKEELQSVNEELVTVNSQLQDKVEALDAANSDLTNLMAATDIAIIFLDTQLRIKRFTPPTARLLNLLATDIDRPFRDLSPRFEDRDLQRDMQRVLKTLKPIETTIHADQDLWYLRRIMPYRAGDNRVGGVVITFIDITGRLQADAHARRLATVLRDSNDAVVVCDLNGRITAWNRGAERAYGYSETEALELNMRDLIPSEREMSVAEIAERINRGEAIDPYETTRVTRDGRRLNVWVVLTALVDKSGKPVAIARTERDVTEQKALQKEILDIATVGQHRIGQELHDGTQQELTGLGLLAQHLSEALDDKSKEGELAAKLAAGIAETNRRVRALAQGLIPVAIDAEGLMAALGELAKSTEQSHGVRCRFECPVPVEVPDDMMATHLYRIGQEAVTNAIKHARAGVITIELLSDRGELKLEVRDDGIGIEESGARRQGLGLRTMDYRCALIGGELTVRRQEAGGTAVSCTVPPRAPADVARRTS